jgi:hypothetical protein
MAQRIDYYTLLSRAVESLEADAYAARGVVYDREHKALLKRLISSPTPCSDADIASEELAFRDAIRRIEFPDEEVEAPRTPQRERTEAAWPSSSREKARASRREWPQAPAMESAPEAKPVARRRWGASYEETGRKPLGQPIEPTPAGPQDDMPSWNEVEPKSRSLIRLVAVYMLGAAIVLGAGALGYAYVVGAINFSWLSQGREQAAPRSERAILSEGGQSGQASQPVEGKAVWRIRTEPNGADGKPETVVTFDADIPEPHLALTMKLSRVTDAGASMSHLLELGFGKPDQLPFGGITRLANVGMRGAETDGSESLVGTSINIAPGQFMFGLLGVPDVVRQNVERLRTQNWLDFTIIFGNGATYTLSVAKGASGKQAIDEAFTKWGQ